ncbi:hypothetical protein ACFPPA_10730 [Rhodanobacter ginsengisoli]|uniref:Anti-sigma factor n=1 Tax=Rhodanobacter ginsengisoli TaxID=418646 RepID=A0ABW0QRJ4_9GAMM
MTTPMPPTDPPTPDGKLPGEAELAALYRQLPQHEPGPALDAAVLRAAAQALAAQDAAAALERRKAPRERGDWVHPKAEAVATVTPIRPREPAAAGRRGAPRWLIGLGSAASLVLVAGLAWRMRQVPPSSPAPVEQTAGAPTTAMPPAPSATRNEPMPPPAPMRQRTPPPAERMAYAPAAAPMAKSRGGENKPVAGNAMKVVAPPVVAEAPAPPPPAQVASRAPRDAMATADRASAGAAAPMTMQAAPAPPAAEADTGVVTAARPGDTPAQELDKIRQLFAQGHDDEARQRLRAFRQAHPRWTLPPELQAQLRQP